MKKTVIMFIGACVTGLALTGSLRAETQEPVKSDQPLGAQVVELKDMISATRQALETKPAPDQKAAAEEKQSAAEQDAEKKEIPCLDPTVESGPYTIGVDDVLFVNVLKPEKLENQVTVAPDGSISFPYIGSVMTKGRTVDQIQKEIQDRLGNGYMKYPVVSVSLKESRSKKFFVYGEVLKPGAYAIEENTSVLRAISIAGGFTRFGSSSRVKVLRPKKSGPSYQAIKINITAVMNGDCSEDLVLHAGDVVVVSEGVF